MDKLSIENDAIAKAYKDGYDKAKSEEKRDNF